MDFIEPEAEVEAAVGAEADVEAAVGTEADVEAAVGTEADVEAAVGTEADVEAAVGTEADVEAAVGTEADVEAAVGTEADVEAAVGTEADVEAAVGTEADVEAAVGAEAGAEDILPLAQDETQEVQPDSLSESFSDRERIIQYGRVNDSKWYIYDIIKLFVTNSTLELSFGYNICRYFLGSMCFYIHVINPDYTINYII